MTTKPPWSIRIHHYGVEDSELMREILLAAGVPARVLVERRGDVVKTEGFTVYDPETTRGQEPAWLAEVGNGQHFGDYLRGFIPRYLGPRG